MSAQNADNPSQLKKSKLTMTPISESLRLKLSDLGYTSFFTETSEPSAKDAITGKHMNNIHPSSIIYPGVTIGKNVHIGAFCVIGGPPEHREFIGKPHKSVRIGDNVFIGNHCTIDSGTTGDTVVESNIMILCHSHLGHDVRVCDGSFVSAGCVLGGHTTLRAEASMGLRSVTKPHVTIWEKAMLAMAGAATKNIPMGEIWAGVPAVFLKRNERKL